MSMSMFLSKSRFTRHGHGYRNGHFGPGDGHTACPGLTLPPIYQSVQQKKLGKLVVRKLDSSTYKETGNIISGVSLSAFV
jgi:hypothetical protein